VNTEGRNPNTPSPVAPHTIAAAQLRGAQSEEPDDVAGRDERVGNHGPIAQRHRGYESSTELGQQDRAVWALG